MILLNIRLNKHRDDACQHDVYQYFKQISHTYNKHAKITIIEQLKHQDKGLAAMRAMTGLLEKEIKNFKLQQIQSRFKLKMNKEKSYSSAILYDIRRKICQQNDLIQPVMPPNMDMFF